MAFFTDTLPRATVFENVRSLPVRVRRSLDRRRRIAEVRRELVQLSDRDLNDIGLSRSDIDQVARQSVDGI